MDDGDGIERNLEMSDKDYALRSILIIALFWAITAGMAKSTELSLTDKTLQAIENCMSRTPYYMSLKSRVQHWAIVLPGLCLAVQSTY